MKFLRVSLFVLLLAGLSWVVGTHYFWDDGSDTCDMCGRLNRTAMRFKVLLEDGTTKEACCPRCGLHFQKGREDIVRMEAADFSTGDRIDARSAVYLESSSVHLCCAVSADRDRSGEQYQLAWDRCMPSLLAFKTQEKAAALGRTRGGQVRTWAEITGAR